MLISYFACKFYQGQSGNSGEEGHSGLKGHKGRRGRTGPRGERGEEGESVSAWLRKGKRKNANSYKQPFS